MSINAQRTAQRDTQREGANRNDVATTNDTIRQVAVVAATVGTLIVNWAADALPINGISTAQISDQNPTFFTPAGYVFAIWGVIYLGLSAYTLWQALPAQRTNPRLCAIGWIYVASCVINMVWIFMWHNLALVLCALIIAALLISLIVIYTRLRPYRDTVSAAELWTTHIPFSIYLGWLSVATIANTAIALSSSGWDGSPLTGPIWAVIMLVVASALGFIFGLVKRDPAYVAVLAWAFAGIYVSQSDTPLVAWTAAGLSAVMVVVMVLAFLRREAPARRLA